MRREHLDNGAFLVEFKNPDNLVDVCEHGSSISMDLKQTLWGNELQSAIKGYRTMERKGFHVTKDIGCLIPEAQYCTYQNGATKKGHQRTFEFFARWIPLRKKIRNEFGWPCSLSISHLCHRRNCARIDHLVVEEHWRTAKRNYCGSSGSCDCGNNMKCLRRYTKDDQCENLPLCKTKQEVEQVLEGAPEFVIKNPSLFLPRETKAEQRKVNRAKRKRRQARHAYVTKRKQSRLASHVSTQYVMSIFAMGFNTFESFREYTYYTKFQGTK